MDIQYDFDLFVTAQNAVYKNMMAELNAGRKESHWMWYIFPQIERLGPRLIECTKAAFTHGSASNIALLGKEIPAPR